LRRPTGAVPSLERVNARSGRRIVTAILSEEDDVWLEPAAVRELLTAYGIQIVPEREASTAEEAITAAAELGYPVVVKTAMAGAHKSETGGVALNLTTGAEVREAAERIGAPLLVQPMVSGSAELLAGVVQDPVFGPLVAFGPGGVLAELIGDATFRIAPLTDLDAQELVGSGKAGRLVHGFRGRSPADADALADLLHRLSRLAEDLPEVAELDLNPVVGMTEGCVAVDARIRVQKPGRVPSRKSW
jgi:acyl-CoA synthetase (NDP forming)